MSEDQPRLSRREMRERGLLKPADAETADELREKLTYTQELRLGRISRRQLREQAESESALTAASSLSATSSVSATSGDEAPVVPAVESVGSSAESAAEAAPEAPAEQLLNLPSPETAPSDINNGRRSVFERFDSAPLLDDGIRPVPSAPTPGVAAVNDDASSEATLEERLLARVQQDTAESQWPNGNPPSQDGQSPIRQESIPAAPTRTPVMEKAETIDIEEEVSDEKPRGFLMIFVGILLGLALGVLIGVLARNFILSSDPASYDLIQNTAAAVLPFHLS